MHGRPGSSHSRPGSFHGRPGSVHSRPRSSQSTEILAQSAGATAAAAAAADQALYPLQLQVFLPNHRIPDGVERCRNLAVANGIYTFLETGVRGKACCSCRNPIQNRKLLSCCTFLHPKRVPRLCDSKIIRLQRNLLPGGTQVAHARGNWIRTIVLKLKKVVGLHFPGHRVHGAPI